MKPSPVPGAGAQLAIAALVLLGMIGGCLILAQSGFATSPKRGGPSVFVPAPQAYLLAAILYAMSAIGLLALLRARQAAMTPMVLAVMSYLSVAAGLVWMLSPR
jgi:cytochrome bd-type quinol oxidase subunit 2